MAGWPLNNPKSLDSNTMFFLQNCDLPPPQKLLSAESMAAGEEKLELLKAVRLSQTRAREGERKAKRLAEERDCIGRAFLDEARVVFCYRQTVKLLELRARQWRKQKRERGREREEEDDEDGEGEGDGGMEWIWAFAICLGVAGIVMGCTSFL